MTFYINTDAEDYEIQIINLNGQVLYSGKNVGRVDVSGYVKGIYFIRVNTGNIREMIKFLII